MTDLRAVAAQLWCLPQHSHKVMDVEFAESIAQALADERRKVWEEAAKVAETLGVHPALNVWDGGPEWYKHGKEIAAEIRTQLEAHRKEGA